MLLLSQGVKHKVRWKGRSREGTRDEIKHVSSLPPPLKTIIIIIFKKLEQPASIKSRNICLRLVLLYTWPFRAVQQQLTECRQPCHECGCCSTAHHDSPFTQSSAATVLSSVCQLSETAVLKLFCSSLFLLSERARLYLGEGTRLESCWKAAGRHSLGEPGLLWKSHVSEGRLDEQELPCQQLLSLLWVPQRGTRVPAVAPAETLALADCAPSRYVPSYWEEKGKNVPHFSNH